MKLHHFTFSREGRIAAVESCLNGMISKRVPKIISRVTLRFHLSWPCNAPVSETFGVRSATRARVYISRVIISHDVLPHPASKGVV